MSEPLQSGDDPAVSERPRMPRWVVASLVAGAVLVALVVVLLASGHGPGQHMSHAGAPLSPAVVVTSEGR